MAKRKKKPVPPSLLPFPRLIELYREIERKIEAKQHRSQGLENKAIEQSILKAGSFCHLPWGIREIALEKYAEYQLKHADKIASIRDPLARGRYLGCLAACATTHAKYKGMIGGTNPKLGRNRRNWRASLRTRLGLQVSRKQRERDMQLAALAHYGNGQPIPAIIGQTNLEGI